MFRVLVLVLALTASGCREQPPHPTPTADLLSSAEKDLSLPKDHFRLEKGEVSSGSSYRRLFVITVPASVRQIRWTIENTSLGADVSLESSFAGDRKCAIGLEPSIEQNGSQSIFVTLKIMLQTPTSYNESPIVYTSSKMVDLNSMVSVDAEPGIYEVGKPIALAHVLLGSSLTEQLVLHVENSKPVSHNQ